jgi:PAS domain S-box-containing protein
MAQFNPFPAVIPEQSGFVTAAEHCTRIHAEYVVVVNAHRKFEVVSRSFCKLVGYAEEELMTRSFDEITLPRTNHIPSTWRLLQTAGSISGIWVFRHKGGTKLFVRFEAFVRRDRRYEVSMELLGAGA